MTDNDKIPLPHIFPNWGITLTKHTLIRTQYNYRTWYRIKHLYIVDSILFIQPKSAERPYQAWKPFQYSTFLPAELCPYKYGITRHAHYTITGDLTL